MSIKAWWYDVCHGNQVPRCGCGHVIYDCRCEELRMSECSKHERERRQGSPCPYCRIAELEAEQQRRDLLISEAASARAAQEARIAELEAAKELQFEIMALKEQTIDDLQARLELKTAMPWEEDWERGYVCGWNECRKAALRGDDDQ